MFRQLAPIVILISLALLLTCSEKEIISASQRPLMFWSPPDDFRPSYITQDENGKYWGLFISKRYSGRYNLWGVSSRDGTKWLNPFMIENAYYFSDLEFSVRNDSLFFIYYQIGPEYFSDHGLGLGAYVDYKDELELSYSVKSLLQDRDRDNIPDNIENELLTSNRLPDTDLDGKPDFMDYNPLSKPAPKCRNHDLYEAVLLNIIKSAGLDTMRIQKDSAWSRFYGIYVLKEPSPLYVSFPAERQTFEFEGFPFPIISVKTPLWFGSRPLYRGLSGGTIPHINFKGVKHVFLRERANVYVEVFRTEEYVDDFQFVMEKKDGEWNVASIIAIEDKEDEPVTDTASEEIP